MSRPCTPGEGAITEAVWWQEFAERKIRSTECLLAECGGTYGDVILILTAIVSAAAAQCWPGKGIDKKRFIELVVRGAPETTVISIPRLMAWLTESGEERIQQLLEELEPSQEVFDGRILLADDVDMREERVVEALGDQLHLSRIRSFSYAAMIYEDLRCSYTHEYKIGSNADTIQMSSSRQPVVSYVNCIHERYPYIHFNLNWLAGVVRASVAEAGKNTGNPSTQPIVWWIDGVGFPV